ncbi:hypothetical protein BSZ21_06260 [Bradyrhizobium canariense]|nr:hypothetical protein BSZ21_06260 [Bradyrhizobium canariense]
MDVFVDEQFLRDRARIIRDLADKADPFIRKRLLDLAERYDRRISRPSQAMKMVTAAISPTSTIASSMR